MNVLFLTLARISNIEERGIYTDLIREFVRHGHIMHIVVPAERRFHQSTELQDGGNVKILKVWTFNIQKTNLIERELVRYFWNINIRRQFKSTGRMLNLI